MTLDEFLNRASEQVKDGYTIAVLTDEYIVDRWSGSLAFDLEQKKEKLLEVRVFDTSRELKLSRGDIARNLSFREIIDDDRQKMDTFDEIQCLDIDDTRSIDIDGRVVATGGGKYKLPIPNINNAKIKIRYYVGKYDETGQAIIKDWRVVGFVEGK